MECWYENHCASCNCDISTKPDGSYGQCYDNFNCLQDCGKNFCDDCYETKMKNTDDGLTCLECIKKYNMEPFPKCLGFGGNPCKYDIYVETRDDDGKFFERCDECGDEQYELDNKDDKHSD